MDQYGIDATVSLQITAKYAKRRKAILIVSDNQNAGKSVSRDKDSEVVVKTITEVKKEIKRSLSNEKSKDSKVVSKGSLLGADMLASFCSLPSSTEMMDVLTKVVEKVKDEQLTAEQAAKELETKFLDTALSDDLSVITR